MGKHRRGRSRGTARVALGLCAAFVATVHIAKAQPVGDERISNPPPPFERAKDCLANHDEMCARSELDRAYKLTGNPEALRLLAEVRARLGERVQALDDYERYARECEAKSGPKAEPCTPVADAIAALRRQLAELELDVAGAALAEPSRTEQRDVSLAPPHAPPAATSAASESVAPPSLRQPRAGCACAAAGQGETSALAGAVLTALVAGVARARRRLGGRPRRR